MSADVKFAVRSIGRRPWTTLAIASTLALGIGSVTVVFRLAEWLLLRPVPGVERESELVTVSLQPENGDGRFSFSNPIFENLRAGAGTVDLVATNAISLHVTPPGGVPERIDAEIVSEGFARVLGLRMRGRMPAADALTEIAISEEGWRRWFGRSEDALGSTIAVNGVAFDVVGIMPPGFRGASLSSGSLAWVPASAYRAAVPITPEGILENVQLTFWNRVLGRMRDDVALEAADAELRAVSARILESTPWRSQRFVTEAGIAVSPYLRTRIGSMLGLLMGIVGALLLLACANTANLGLARAESRRSELIVRRAMGASSGDLVRHVMLESISIALLGGGIAVILATPVLRLLSNQRLLGWLPPLGEVRMDTRVLVVSAVAAVAAGMLFAIAPAVVTAQGDIAAGLRDASRGSRRESRLGRALVGLQIGISLVLLVGAGLLGRTLVGIARTDPGIDTRSVVQFSLDPGTQGLDATESAALFRRVVAALEASPAVESASMAWLAPFGYGRAGMSLAREGADAGDEGVSAPGNMVGAGWFATMGMRLLQGREFTKDEEFPLTSASSSPRGPTGPAEGRIVLSESLARSLFGAEPALGRYVTSRYENGRRYEIIGIAGDARVLNLRTEPESFAWVPIGQMFPLRSATFDVRARTSIGEVTRVIREVVGAEASNVPIFDLRSLESAAAATIQDDRFMAAVSAVLGVLGLVLAAIGLSGVASQSVTRRARELGIRLALGARSHQAMRVVIARVAVPASIGAAAGLLASLALSRLLTSRLYEMQPYDPVTYAAAVAVLLVICAAATLIPASRALRLDPLTTLRDE